MEETIIDRLNVRKIIPARSWDYMYAISDKGNYFIYANYDSVAFFGEHEAQGISDFQDTFNKLPALKYIKETSDALKLQGDQKIIKVGTCLVTKDFSENYKADIFVDERNEKIEFHLKDAGESKRNSKIEFN